MKDHEKYLKQISLYADDEMAENQLEDFKHHLEACDICRKELELLEYYQGQISDSGETQISPEINSAIMNYAREAEERKGFFEMLFGSFNFKLNLAVSTAFVIIGLFAGIFFSGLSNNKAQIDNYTMNEIELYNTVFPGSIAESYIILEE